KPSSMRIRFGTNASPPVRSIAGSSTRLVRIRRRRYPGARCGLITLLSRRVGHQALLCSVRVPMPFPMATRDIYSIHCATHSIFREPRSVSRCAKKIIPTKAGRGGNIEPPGSGWRVKFEKLALTEIVELPGFGALRQAQGQYRLRNFFGRWQRQRIDARKSARIHARARGAGTE